MSTLVILELTVDGLKKTSSDKGQKIKSMNPRVKRDKLQRWKRWGYLSAEAPLRPGFQ